MKLSLKCNKKTALIKRNFNQKLNLTINNMKVTQFLCIWLSNYLPHESPLLR